MERLGARVATSDERGHPRWCVNDHDVGEAVFTKELGRLFWGEGRARRELRLPHFGGHRQWGALHAPDAGDQPPPWARRDARNAGKASRTTSGGMKINGSQTSS
jgi:hypothetical protein